MRDFFGLIWSAAVGPLRSRAAVAAGNLVLRQQVNILRRCAPKRLRLSSIDRLIFVGLYRVSPDVRDALAIIKPDTVIRWHYSGFKAHWRWKSRSRGGRPSGAKDMARRRRRPSQGWKTLLRNHADGIAAMDLFVVPTISLRLLYGLLILRHDRRRILSAGATAHPTADEQGRRKHAMKSFTTWLEKAAAYLGQRSTTSPRAGIKTIPSQSSSAAC